MDDKKITSATEMQKGFTEYIELKAYSDAQARTLIEVSKKIKKLEDENKELKKQLMNSVPLLKADETKPNFATTDEETICRQQIFGLRQISMERELTLEETKKLDIYTKILISLENKPKTIEVKSKGLSNEELMALASSFDKKDESSEPK